MNVLVTGGAGFLGSHLCDRLMEDGHSVWCMDDLSTGDADNVSHLLDRRGFTYIEQDVSTWEPSPTFPIIQQIYHLASPASPVAYRNMPVHTLMAGSRGTQNMLDLAHGDNGRILLASTSEVYGDPQVHPQPETYWGNVNPVGWRSCYDEAKRYAEALVMAYRTEGLVEESRIARIFNTYGPRMGLDDGRPVVTFIKAALAGTYLPVQGDGQQTRSFCYVSDTVDALVRLMEGDYDMPVNIGNPYGKKTIEQLAQIIIEMTHSESEIHYVPRVADDPQDRQPDITVAREQLYWEPTINMQDGLRYTINYVREKMGMKKELIVDYR